MSQPSAEALHRYRVSEKGRKAKREYMRRRRATPAGREETARIRRKSHLKRTYGLTVEQYEELGNSQGWRCAICESELKLPQIDHDHATGAVRGLLCFLCNSGLGKFKDDPTFVRRAAEYLEGHCGV